MEFIKTSYKLEGFVESRRGGRAENQDYLDYRDTEWGFLIVVCDGMGGGPAGQVASSQAVSAIINYIDKTPFDRNKSYESLLREAISYANKHLLDLQRNNPQLRGMGTTATVLLIDKTSAKLAHIGDSRIYQFRFGRKKFRTTDHSQVMELVKVGTLTEEEARTAPNSNVISKALGVTETADPDVCELDYEKDDRFVLCTDGVWGSMPENKLIDLLARTKTLSGTVESTMITVEEIGRDNGCHHDNFTLALVKTNHNSNYKEPMSHKVRNILALLLVVCCISLMTNVIFGYKLSNIKDPNTEASSMSEKNTQAYIDSVVQVRLQEESIKKDSTKTSLNDENKDKTTMERKNTEPIISSAEKSATEDKTAAKEAAADKEEGLSKEDCNIDILKKNLNVIKSELENLSNVDASKPIPQSSLDSIEKELNQLCLDLRKNNMTESADLIERDVITKLKNSIAKDIDKSKNDSRKGHYKTLSKTLDKILVEILK